MKYVADNVFSSGSNGYNLPTCPDIPDSAVNHCLNRLTQEMDDANARQIVRELLSAAVDRIRRLCGSTLNRRYPRLVKGPFNVQPEEVLSAVVERLIKALRTLRPGTVREFYSLVTKHIRWELNGLARKLDGERHERLETDLVAHEPKDIDEQFSPLGRRILEVIARLPQMDQDIFNLVRVRGMRQPDAAEVLGISERTIQRRLKHVLPHLWAELGAVQSPLGPMPLQNNTLLPIFITAETVPNEQSPVYAA